MMTDHEVEARLRRTLEAVAETTKVDDRPAVQLGRVAAEPRRQWFARPALSMAVGFFVVLVSVGAALVMAGRGAVPQTGATAPIVERFPVFGVLSDEVEVAAEVSVSPEEPRYVKLVLGTPTEAGFADAVNVLVWEEPATVTISASETVMVGAIEVEVSPADPTERVEIGVTAFWSAQGVLLQAHDPGGRTDLALSVVDAITVDVEGELAADSVEVGDLPAGIEVLAEPQLGTYGRSGRVTAQFTDGQLVATISRSTSALGAAVLGGNGEAVEVRGHPGYLTRVADWEILTWQETPDVAAKLSATAGVFTLEQMLSYAGDLTYVDETTWAAIYESAELPSGLAPTTTTPPAYTIDVEDWEVVGAFADSSQPPIRWVTIHNTTSEPTGELEEVPSLTLATGGPFENQLRQIESGSTIPDGSFPLLEGEAFILSDHPGAGVILWASPTGTVVWIEYNYIDREQAQALLTGLLPLTEPQWNSLIDKNQGGPTIPAIENDPTQ